MRPLAFVVGAGFVAAVGCSVLILSWHYPSDVLGGILVASAWGFAALACLNWAEQLGELRRPAQVSSRAAISVK